MSESGRVILGSLAFVALLAVEVLTPGHFFAADVATVDGKLGHLAAHEEADTLCPRFETPGHRRYALTAEQILWEVEPGNVIPVWAWNGTIPGPTLCARVGDTVEVTITNRLPTIISFHTHGLRFAPLSDGTFHTGSYAVPGGTYTYHFEVGEDSVGTWAYHDSVAEMDESPFVPGVSTPESGEGIERGLYGAFVVQAADEEIVDHEFVVAMSDMGPEVSRGGTYMLVNGRASPLTPTFHVMEGEKVRFRLINAGPNDPHDFVVKGHTLTNAHTARVVDGASEDEGRRTSVALGSLTFGDYTTVAGEPGEYEYICLVGEHASMGMKGKFIVHPKIEN